jgi:hypothetical protein
MVARRIGPVRPKKPQLNRSQKEYAGYKNYGQARSAQAHVANATRKVSDKIAPRNKPQTRTGKMPPGFAAAIKRKLGNSAKEKIASQTKANTGFNPQEKPITAPSTTTPSTTSSTTTPTKQEAAKTAGFKNFGQQQSAAVHQRAAARKLAKKA